MFISFNLYALGGCYEGFYLFPEYDKFSSLIHNVVRYYRRNENEKNIKINGNLLQGLSSAVSIPFLYICRVVDDDDDNRKEHKS